VLCSRLELTPFPLSLARRGLSPLATRFAGLVAVGSFLVSAWPALLAAAAAAFFLLLWLARRTRGAKRWSSQRRLNAVPPDRKMATEKRSGWAGNSLVTVVRA
jgi:hypothetical protein